MARLKSSYVQKDGEELFVCDFVSDDLTIRLNDRVNGQLIEVEFIDELCRYVCLFYVDWTGLEVFAILDERARPIVKGISEFSLVSKTEDLFILYFNGSNIENRYYWVLKSEVFYWAIVDRFGNCRLDPVTSPVFWDGDEFLVGGRKMLLKG